MTKISISLDDRSKEQLDQIANTTNRSRSDIVRDVVTWYELKTTTDAVQQKAAPLLRRLGLETDEQIAEYAMEANAQLVITFDNDLLTLKAYENIQINFGDVNVVNISADIDRVDDDTEAIPDD
jgi:predicted nucleic acid-binding protein